MMCLILIHSISVAMPYCSLISKWVAIFERLPPALAILRRGVHSAELLRPDLDALREPLDEVVHEPKES